MAPCSTAEIFGQRKHWTRWAFCPLLQAAAGGLIAAVMHAAARRFAMVQERF
jgi:hypothetical protein